MIASPSSAGARGGAAAAAAAAAATQRPPPLVASRRRPLLLRSATAHRGAAAASGPPLPLRRAAACGRRLIHASAATQQAAAAAAAAAAADAARLAAEQQAAEEAAQAAAAKAAALAALRAGPPDASDAARTPSEVLDAIVKVFTTASRPDQWSPWSNHVRRESTGTGFLIAPGLIVTCAHVVSDASYVTLRRHGASQRARAEVVAVGHDVDLALLTVPDEAFWRTPAPIKPLRLAEGVPRLQSRVVRAIARLFLFSLSLEKEILSRRLRSPDAAPTNQPTNKPPPPHTKKRRKKQRQQQQQQQTNKQTNKQQRISAYPSGGDNVCVTSGVTSRVDVTQYVHSASSFMAIQVDSPINGGASGGPCLEEGGDEEAGEEAEEGGGGEDGGAAQGDEGGVRAKPPPAVVGVAFQNIPGGDSQGYIVPMPVVHRFLDEVKRHGRYRGFCSLVSGERVRAPPFVFCFQGGGGGGGKGRGAPSLITRARARPPAHPLRPV
jgi:S1-C subfamily serine protease